MINKFENFCLENSILHEGVRIIVGLSGGADSVAMTMFFKSIQTKYSIFLAAAHVNYGLRNNESDEDESFVRDFCNKLNVPLYVKKVSLLHPLKAGSIQQSAREIRFDYFNKLKKGYSLDYISLAHHADDQTETVLHRFIRGAGYTGLSGILPIKGNIIHPMLIFTRKEIEHYLHKEGIKYRIDNTNFKNDYTRNSIRNELIPMIKEKYNTNFEQKLLDYSNFFNQTNNYFITQTQKEYKKCLIENTINQVTLNLKAFQKCHNIIQYYICREVWSFLTNKETDFYGIHFQDITKILDPQINDGFKELHLPENVIVMKDYDCLIFRKTDKHIEPNRQESKQLKIVRNVFSFNEIRFSMTTKRNPYLNKEPDINLKQDRYIATFDLDKIIFPITLRYRTEGDKFIPYGMNGFKKIKDYFIDEKVPMLERDNIIIFTDAEKILWICGYRTDNRVAIDDKTKNYLVIKKENNTPKKSRAAERTDNKKKILVPHRDTENLGKI